MSYTFTETNFSLFSGLDTPLTIGDILTYIHTIESKLEQNDTIFGIDPDFEPAYDVTKIQGNTDLEFRRQMLNQSTIQLDVSKKGDLGTKGHDLYSQFYDWLTTKYTSIGNFLTSVQWENRSTILSELGAKPLKLYSEIHNKDLRYNFNYQITNELSSSVVRKAAGDLITEMLSVEGGIQGQIKGIIESIASVGDAVYTVAQKIDQATGGTEKETGQVMQFKNQVISTMKMKQHETVKLWGASKLTMTQKMKFLFRQTSPENLDLVYYPLLKLILMATPFTYTLGVDSSDTITDKSILSGLTEIVPPVSLQYNFGNGLFLNEYCIISDLKYELYDYKYVDFHKQSLTVPEKLLNRIIPTVQEVEISVDSILPLVQYYRLLKEHTSLPPKVALNYNQLGTLFQ